MTESQIKDAIINVLARGDQDGQPWAFYEHDHGGVKGSEWTAGLAMRERVLFAEAVVRELERFNR